MSGQPASDARLIAYLWAPEFGAAVARRAAPGLGAGPLALLDDQGRVLAVDAAAARAGVRLGLAERQAALCCPAAARLPAARFPLWEAQERFLDRLKPFTDRWQPDGLGRAYLDATHVIAHGPAARHAADAGAWCRAVTAAAQAPGWQLAIGATGSKFGASVAGQVAARRGEPVLAPPAQRAFLAGQPAELLPLDGDALLQLRYLGIRTLGAYAQLPAAGVLTRFGAAGRVAQRWALGLDDRPVTPPWEAPECSARVEFETPEADSTRLLAALLQRAERLLRPLRGRLQAIARLLLAVTRADGRTIPISHTFPLPTAAWEAIRLALAGLLPRLTADGQGVTEVTLTLAGITDTPGQQLALFADTTAAPRSRLTATVDRLAGRFGADAFRLACVPDPDHVLLERRAAFAPWH